MSDANKPVIKALRTVLLDRQAKKYPRDVELGSLQAPSAEDVAAAEVVLGRINGLQMLDVIQRGQVLFYSMLFR